VTCRQKLTIGYGVRRKGDRYRQVVTMGKNDVYATKKLDKQDGRIIGYMNRHVVHDQMLTRRGERCSYNRTLDPSMCVRLSSLTKP